MIQSTKNEIENLIGLGIGALKSDDAKGALDHLKRADKLEPKNGSVKLALYSAYVMRANQLRAQSLIAEGNRLTQTANGFLAKVAEIEWHHFEKMVVVLPLKKAIELYAHFYAKMGQKYAVERIIIDRAFREGLAFLEGMPADHPLKAELLVASAAYGYMTAGLWEKACEALKSVARSSPLAPWRIFAKSMVFFHNGEMPEMKKLVAQLPPDFVLFDASSAIVGEEAPEGLKKSFSFRMPEDLPREAEQLCRHIETGRLTQVVSQIKALAKAIYPQEEALGRLCLLQLVAQHASTFSCGLSAKKLSEMASQLLVYKIAQYAVPKLQMLMTSRPRASGEIEQFAKQYLATSQYEFPEKRCENLAHGVIFEYLARREDSPKEALLLLAKSLLHDSTNREAYQLFSALMRKDPLGLHAECIEVLERMVTQFPRNPLPHVELARIYHGQQKFEKEISALDTAQKIAPYDPLVLKKFAVAQIVGILQKIAATKYRSAREDREVLASIKQEAMAPYVWATHVCIEVREKPTGAFLIVQEKLGPFSGAVQLKYLGVLYALILSSKADILGWALPAIEKHLKSLKKVIKVLDSKEAMQLIAVGDSDIELLCPNKSVSQCFTEYHIDILRRLNFDDFVRALPIFCSIDRIELFRKAIAAKKRDKEFQKFRIYLSFIELVLKWISGKEPYFTQFIRLAHGASPEEKIRLKEIAIILAPFAEMPMKQALLEFDFSRLRLVIFPAERLDIDDDNWSDLEDFDPDEPEEIADFINNFTKEMCGAPARLVRRIYIKMSESQPGFKQEIEHMRKALKDKREFLSRESLIFLFGDEGKA